MPTRHDGARRARSSKYALANLETRCASQAAPALFEAHEGGGKALLNYTVRDGFYVTDRTFRRAALVLGQGKHERRVDLENARFGAAVDAGRPETGSAGHAGHAGGAGGRRP